MYSLPFSRESLCKSLASFLSTYLKLPQESALLRKLELLLSREKPPLFWLQLLDCAGCTEKLLREMDWPLFDFLLELVDLRYHELLMYETGKEAEKVLMEISEEKKGKYLLLIEGAIPYRDRGIFLKIAGEPFMNFLMKISEGAALIFAYGNCAVNGGLPATPPNPTCAIGVPTLLGTDKVISLYGCPGKAKALVALLGYFRLFATLPPLDKVGRPML